MSYRMTSLDVMGHDGESVPSTLFARDEDTTELGVLLPGMGGTADPQYDAERVREMRDAGGRVLVIEDGNPGLEVEGNAVRSAHEMVRIVEQARDFLAG